MGDGPVLSVKLPLTARPHFIRFSRFTSLIPPTAPSHRSPLFSHRLRTLAWFLHNGSLSPCSPLFPLILLCVVFVRTKRQRRTHTTTTRWRRREENKGEANQCMWNELTAWRRETQQKGGTEPCTRLDPS